MSHTEAQAVAPDSATSLESPQAVPAVDPYASDAVADDCPRARGMRTITVPAHVLGRAIGTCLEFAVAVDWPELQLTEAQQIANAIAMASGRVPWLPRAV